MAGRGWQLGVEPMGTESCRQSICALGSATYTAYEWEVRNGVGHKWIVKKRYSDFVQLDKVLTRRHPKAMLSISSIPGKTTWGSKMSESVVERRQKSLDTYLKALCGRPDTKNSQELIDFLEVPLEAALERDDDDFYRGVGAGPRSGSPGETELSTAPTSTSSIRVRAWQQEAEAKWGGNDSLVF